MTDRQPLFRSREEFDARMDDAGLTPEVCVYRAANSSVDTGFGLGFSIGTEESVRHEFAKYRNTPLEVTIDSEAKDPMQHKADIMCAACGMCVTVAGGYADIQRVVLGESERDCPVFEQPPSIQIITES